MITLNDVRRNYEEKEWRYEEKENYLVIRNSTLGDEEVPAAVLVSCDEDFLDIECYLPDLINISLNETVLKTLNSLNQKFRFFQIRIVEVEGKCRLEMESCTPVAYISDAEIAAELVIRSLQIMDGVYVEIMKAKWASK